MNLLLYSNPEESLTSVLLKHQKELNIQPLSLKDLLGQATIFDTIDNGNVFLQWHLPSLGEIKNDKDTYLINRAFFCPEEWFLDFAEEDRKYAQAEFWAYLTFALHSFARKTEGPGRSSLTGNCYPLPTQWEMVKSLKTAVDLPEYYLGTPEGLPITWEKEEIVFGQIYQFYYWKAGSCPKDSKSIFAFKKPKGEPVLCLICQEQVFLYSMDNATPIRFPISLQKRIKKLALRLNRMFKHFICEMLFFVEGDNVTFGMSNNAPVAAMFAHQFEENVLQTMKIKLKESTNGLSRV